MALAEFKMHLDLANSGQGPSAVGPPSAFLYHNDLLLKAVESGSYTPERAKEISLLVDEMFNTINEIEKRRKTWLPTAGRLSRKKAIAALGIQIEMVHSKMKTAWPAIVFALSLSLLSTPSWALARYECKGLAPQTIVLTPYNDGTVTLSFDKGEPEEKTTFVHKGNVFTAEFQNISGQQGATLIYIFDTMTSNGYEFGHLPPKPAFAAKMTCWWFERW
jgi:hypothetical protein